jgi:hypothetical protein
MTAEELARRLINLIFAGWNRMDMIRRELPRTECAGWVGKPFRIEDEEDSPFRGPCAVIGAAVQRNITISGLLEEFFRLGFGVDRDRPDEPEQFAAQGRDHLIFVFAAKSKRLVAFVKAMLCFPGHLCDLLAEG